MLIGRIAFALAYERMEGRCALCRSTGLASCEAALHGCTCFGQSCTTRPRISADACNSPANTSTARMCKNTWCLLILAKEKEAPSASRGATHQVLSAPCQAFGTPTCPALCGAKSRENAASERAARTAPAPPFPLRPLSQSYSHPGQRCYSSSAGSSMRVAGMCVLLICYFLFLLTSV